MNINASVAVTSSGFARGLLTVDSVDGQVEHRYGLQWRRCGENPAPFPPGPVPGPVPFPPGPVPFPPVPVPPLPTPLPPTPPLPLPPTQHSCDVLRAGEALQINESLRSCDGRFALTLQSDGNLVHTGPRGAIWSTATGPLGANSGPRAGYGGRGNILIMQTDGNLVLYSGAIPTWASNTTGYPGAYLFIQNDANLVVYSGGSALWSRITGNLIGR